MKTTLRFAVIVMVCLAFLGLSFTAIAQELKIQERWYAAYYKGKKVGKSHLEFQETKLNGKDTIAFSSKGNVMVFDSASYSGAKVKKTVNYDFKINWKFTAALVNGKVDTYDGKRKSDKMSLKATAQMDGDVLVLERKEGVVDESIRINAGDYDMTSAIFDLEPFLKTVTKEPVTKNVFDFGDAKIKKKTFRLVEDDKKGKNKDGELMPCLTYKITDEDNSVKIKTINGQIVYIRTKDKKTDRVVKYQLTTEQKAKSEKGY